MVYRPPSNVDNRCLLDRILFDGPPGQVQVYQPVRRMSRLVVSIKQGAVEVWFGILGQPLPLVPDLHFGQVNYPVMVDLPPGVQNLTMQSAGPANPVLACVIIEGY